MQLFQYIFSLYAENQKSGLYKPLNQNLIMLFHRFSTFLIFSLTARNSKCMLFKFPRRYTKGILRGAGFEPA